LHDRHCGLNYSSHKGFLEFSDRQKIARQLPNEGLRVSGEWTLGIEVHDATGRLFLTLVSARSVRARRFQFAKFAPVA
jgi:hypothetical protein